MKAAWTVARRRLVAWTGAWSRASCRQAAGALLAVACVLAGPARAAPPAHWKEDAYSYDARKQPLRKVLEDFAMSHNLMLKMTGNFAAPVNGKIRGDNLIDFLDRLGAQQRFQWFVYGASLYVSPLTDSVEERLEIGTESVEAARNALTGLGLFDPKFGWGELPEEGIAVIRGPQEYVRLIRQSIRPQAKKEDPEPMVFRLRYATVDDRTVTVRDQSMVTPGVATLLKNMLAQRESKGSGRTLLTDTKGGLDMPIPPPVNLNSSMAPSSGSLGPLATRSSSISTTRAPAGTSVEGDVRTNSLIIYDVPTKRGFYQRLIDALDTPQRLVEIEAYIIDVNRERLNELGADISLGGSKRAAAMSAAVALGRGSLAGSTLVVQGLQDFIARLRALESKGEARVLAKPSISTLENLVAVLDLSQTVYIKATGERVANVMPVTAGTLLRVTPRVVDQGGEEPMIHLTVDIEDGKVLDRINQGDMPEVSRSNISTQAMLLNEESLVIGGYNVDKTTTRQNAVPGLSKLPGVGGLFRNTEEVEQSRQRLFIITPHIVASTYDRARQADAGQRRERDAAAQTRVQKELGLKWLDRTERADGGTEYEIRIRGH